MTQNCLIAFPNRTDEGTLSGGSWQSTLPLTNLQSRILGKVARSSTAANANTTFKNTLTSAKKIDIVSLVNHNLSLDSTWRVRASNEGAATNLVKYSEQLDQSDWTKYQATITANAVVAPDGNMTMDKVVENTANDSHVVYQDLGSKVAAQYTYSFFLKSAERTKLQVLQTITENFGANYDTATGIATVTFSPAAATMTALSGGIFRCTLSFNTTSTHSLVLASYLFNAVNSANYLGDGVSGLYLWGMQLETGSSATSYYPTTTTSLTRPAGYMDSWQSYLYDSGTITTWPSVYSSTDLEWEYDNFWLGQYSTDEITGYTTAATHVVSTDTIAQYWRVDIYDTNNTSNYVQIGRLFMGPAWQPTYNAEVGLGMGWETNTQSQKALNGTKYYQRRTPYRVTTFNLQCMSVDEAMQNAFEIDRMAGIDKEVFYSFDPDDTLHALRRTYLGTLRELSAIEYPMPNLLKKAYVIEEVV